MALSMTLYQVIRASCKSIQDCSRLTAHLGPATTHSLTKGCPTTKLRISNLTTGSPYKMALQAPWLQDLLHQNTTAKYDIEYKGYLSNHLSHLIIACSLLGATQQKTEDIVKWYCTRLESASSAESQHESGPEGDIEKLLGKRKSYYVLLQHYKDLLNGKYENSLEALIRVEFPKLMTGMAGSALHGLIQLGYGYAARSAAIVPEGLAYLHHSYLPLMSEKPRSSSLEQFGKGTEDVASVVEQLRNDAAIENLYNTKVRDVSFSKEPNSFQRGVSVMLQLAGDQLYDYVNRIQLPSFYDPASKNMSQVHRLIKWLIDIAFTVYVRSERKNDFFLVHGITSAWALKNILEAITKYEDGIGAIQIHMCSLLAVYVTQMKPALTRGLNKDIIVDQPFWDSIVQEVLQGNKDEHIVKLVQVAYERWQDNPSSGIMYANAARLVLDEPFLFESKV